MINPFLAMNRFLKAFIVLLALFYAGMLGLAIYFQVRFDYVIAVVAILLGCSLGLVFRRPWAVKAMAWAGLAGTITAVVEFLRLGFNFDGLLIAFMFFSLMAFLLLQESILRQILLNEKTRFSGRSILLIDDDRSLLKLLQTNLRKEGFFVVTADTGEKGLTLAQRYRPDLIILDVILPGIKGRKVCSLLQENPRTKGIPVIFLTAKDSPDDIQAEMAVGGAAHITKPVDYRNLLQEIGKYLPQ